jgi:plastocyanin
MKMLLIPLCAAGALLLPNVGTNTATGAVAGKVVFDGERPDSLPDISPKPEETEGCHHDGHTMDLTDRTLLIGEDGGIANVVVTIGVADAEVELREEPIVVDQMSCRFEPHIQVVRAGETIKFTNSDDTNHNVHTYPKKNKQVNNNVASGSSYEMVLDKEETIKVGCDIHPWMGGYVFVTEASHFAVTAPDGSFKIADLPAGEYKAEYWHETLGKGKADVTVTDGGTAELKIEMSAEKKGGRRRG